MIDRHRQAFIEEARELLSELESSLLELEVNSDDTELIAKVFRALHTIKGSSAMFGFEDVAIFTHDIENVFDCVRNGELEISKELINLTLSARDQISLMISDNQKKNETEELKEKEIISAFKSIINNQKGLSGNNDIAESVVKNNDKTASQRTCKYKIVFAPSSEIFMSGTNPILLLNELRTLGDCKIVADVSSIPDFTAIDPTLCYMKWEIELSTKEGIDSIKDVFIFVEDSALIKIEELDVDEPVFDTAITKIIAHKNEELFPTNEANRESGTKKEINKEFHLDNEGTSSIRVAASKLDELVNLVGELVIVQARLSELSAKENSQEISSIAEEVERLTWDLRDSALNIRMLPIGTTFSKFKRLVRDLANSLGKKIELTTSGAETELDKTVIEKLNDPLVHIIRNCVDHGIEDSGVRRNSGKPEIGKIHLSATQSGGSVLIRISDDGNGIDEIAVKNKAVKLGLIPADAEPSKAEIFALILNAGFSTASSVTNVSGRGVGMDVVKQAIENLRGSIEFESEKGAGTAITLKIPLTLAIIDGLLVKINDSYFVLPLSSVEECIELINSNGMNTSTRNLINVRGEIVPFIRIRDFFRLDGIKPLIEQIVIVDIKGRRIGFVVDNVIGQHQTVIKNLGSIYKNIEGVSGATILGDGNVALIIDAMKVAQNSEIEEKRELLKV